MLPDRQIGGIVPCVVETPGSIEFDQALRTAGPNALFDVIDVFDPDALDRLAAYASGRDTALPGFWNAEDLGD